MVFESGELGVGFGELFTRENDPDALAGDRVPKGEVPHIVVGLTRSEDDTPTLGEELTLIGDAGHAQLSLLAS